MQGQTGGGLFNVGRERILEREQQRKRPDHLEFGAMREIL